MTRITLAPHRTRPAVARHPWVYARDILAIDGQPADGEEVEVLNADGQFFARGLYNSHSSIRLRLYSWQPGVPLDRVFFHQRLQQAIHLRQHILQLDGPRNAWRVLFSEADFLSGLVVDKYADWLTLQFTSLALAQRRDLIADCLQELLQPRGMYLRTERGVGQLEGLVLQDHLFRGEAPPQELVIAENGLEFLVNIAEGQKTGFYLDQRDNRRAVSRLCVGKRVLDAFCYTGGFGLTAAAAGAAEVVGLDASESALALARQNAERNRLAQVQFHRADVFTDLARRAQARECYDVVILDPPKFARTRNALPKALHGYRRLARLALKLLAPGGILVFCCCTGLITLDRLELLLAETALSSQRDLQILERRGPAPDHPVAASCRESAYLKCLITRVA